MPAASAGIAEDPSSDATGPTAVAEAGLLWRVPLA